MSGTPIVIVCNFQPSQQVFKMNFSNRAVDEETEIRKLTTFSRSDRVQNA